MCDTICLPNHAEVETISDLEQAFGVPVDEFHLFPSLLIPALGEEPAQVKEACLCYVDLESYMNAAQATWHYAQPDPGDIVVLMMPPAQRRTLEPRPEYVVAGTYPRT